MSAVRWPCTSSAPSCDEPVVEALVVAVVEALLLERPLEVPVRLGDEDEAGMARLDGARSPSASSRRPAAAPPRSPQVRSKTSFIISIAMSQRTPSHWSAIEPSVSITAPRRSGEKAFSWTTSGQAGKYGSRPFASTRSPTATNDAGSRSRSSSLPRDEVLRVRRRPRVVGRDVVRDEVEDQPERRARASAVARRRQPLGPPRCASTA